MNSYYNTCTNIRNQFLKKYIDEDFVIDKTGKEVVEIIGASFIADDNTIFGAVNQEYIEKEIAWYESMDRNINAIFNGTRQPPVAWQYVADDDNIVNSNYGYIIFSDEWHNQYDNCKNELIKNIDTRRASMIYQTPSIWHLFNENNRNDFICTNAVTYYIRDNKLDCVVQMRSNDAWAGYRNDYAWQKYVLDKLHKDLVEYYPDLKIGNMFWQVQSLHVYKQNFYLIEHYHKTGKYNVTKKEVEIYNNDK